MGCCCPPSASHEALTLLSDYMKKFSDSDFVLLGDFWDWLTKSSNAFKDICDALNLSQLNNNPTRLNLKHMDKSTLLDIILTNSRQKYSSVGIFSNDVSDHCTIACVRNCKLPKCKPKFIFRRNYKHFSEQAFLHDLYNSKVFYECEMADVDLAWNYLDNPWFNKSVSSSIRERNIAWAKAKRTNKVSDWE